MQQIGRYEIVSELGRGAMGIVYRAEDPVIGRTVAIKTIRLGDITDPQEHQRLRARLFREARSAGILSHPNIVTVYDIGEQGDLAYIAMEYVSGNTLDHLMRAETGTEKHVLLSVAYETAIALDYAHQKGIIHRDIKPANIMINDNGAVKITDFGVAKILSQQVTQADLVLGTPSYMSPEQIEAKSLDGRSDQFALAVIVYEMLTGEKPFLGDTLPSLLFRIVKEDPMPPNHLNPTLGPEVAEVLGKAMYKKSAGRYATCADFSQALTESLNLHPGWRPLARGAAANMATIVESVPEVTRAETTLGQSAKGTEQPASGTEHSSGEARESAETRAVGAPVEPSAHPPKAATVETARAPVEPPAPVVAPEPSPPAPHIHERPRALRDQLEPPPPSNLIRNAAIAGILAAVLGAAWFFGRGLISPRETASDTPPAVEPPKVPSGAKPVEPPVTPPPGAQPPAQQPPPTPPPQQQPPPASSARLAFVEVESDPPSASVSFDQGAQTCTTPCALQLPPGRHVMELSLAGYRNAPRIFNLPQDAKHNIKLDRQTGILQIKSTPSDAQILINGQLHSQHTPSIVTLPIGKYKIALRKQGFRDYEEEVEVRDGVTRSIEVSW